eukprot:m.183653 g.183653  ORF g.183653 m.183653 type:complete len:781 (-) comp18084_c0_seq1:243-2585(-)
MLGTKPFAALPHAVMAAVVLMLGCVVLTTAAACAPKAAVANCKFNGTGCGFVSSDTFGMKPVCWSCSGVAALTTLPCKDAIPDNATTLILSHTGIQGSLTWPFDLPQSVTSMDFSYNNITAFGDDVHMTALQQYGSLDFSHNAIASLEVDLSSINIENLDLSYNRITSLPPGTFNSYKGFRLDLSHNHLTSVYQEGYSAFTDSVLISEVYMSHNRFEYFPSGAFGQLTSETLILSYNPIQFVTTYFMDAVVVSPGILSMAHCNISYLQGSAFQSRSLEGTNLDLSHNHLTSIDAAMLDGLAQLSTLNLSNNNIETVETLWYGALTLSVNLDMSNNPSVCSIDAKSVKLVQCTCASGFLGDGRFCNTVSCEKAELLKLAPPETHGAYSCPSTVASGQSCTLTCNSGYAPVGIDPECRGGSWLSGTINTFPTCVRESHALNIAAVAAGTCGGVLMFMCIAFFCRRRLQRRHREELGLREKLLQETKDEVATLKNAWNIEQDHVTLVQRVDLDSEGATGEVWSGIWHELPVAVKKLRISLVMLDEQSVGDFTAEVALMRGIRHPNIVLFFGAGTWDAEVPFLVTELLARGSLHSLLKKHSSFPWAQKVGFARDAARGLKHLHTLGCIHRDIKSGNLLVSEKWSVKVADFGTSKLCSTLQNSAVKPIGDKQSAMTMTTKTGTGPWMAPEVMRGDPYSLSADVYSFGCVVYELIEHKAPWWHLPNQFFMSSLWTKLIDEDQRPTIPETCPPAWRTIMEATWATDPSARPSFEQLVSTLDTLDLHS